MIEIKDKKLDMTQGEFVSILFKFLTGKMPDDTQREKLLTIINDVVGK